MSPLAGKSWLRVKSFTMAIYSLYRICVENLTAWWIQISKLSAQVVKIIAVKDKIWQDRLGSRAKKSIYKVQEAALLLLSSSTCAQARLSLNSNCHLREVASELKEQGERPLQTTPWFVLKRLLTFPKHSCLENNRLERCLKALQFVSIALLYFPGGKKIYPWPLQVIYRLWK